VSQRLFSTLAEWLSAESVVLASVLATRGASPRHGGAQMLITASRIAGSVGGGRLELHTIAAARELLGTARQSEAVAIDLTGREVGDSIHLSSVALPKNTTVRTHEKDLTIATIAAPSGLRSEEAAAASAEPAAAAEPAKK